MFPPLIEYLLARSNIAEGPSCYQDRSQFIIPQIPPGMQLVFEVEPPRGAYAGIKYAAMFSDDIVPGTLFMEVSQGGIIYGSGIIYADWTRQYLHYWQMFYRGQGIRVRLINISAVGQIWIGTQWAIAIPTEADTDKVKKIIKGYRVSS